MQVYWNSKAPTSKPPTNHSEIITTATIFHHDIGALSCFLVINSEFSILPVGENVTRQYDLNMNTTYIIMAKGNLDPTGLIK